VLLGFRMRRFDRHQVFSVSPVVRNMVIHGYLFPDAIGKEIDGVDVPFLCIANRNRSGRRVKCPMVDRNFSASGAVEDLPPLLGIVVAVDTELFPEVTVQQIDGHGFRFCDDRLTHHATLLQLIHIGLGPFIVYTDYTEC